MSNPPMSDFSKELLHGPGYSVPCLYDIKGNEKTVCVVVHGFGGSKDSFTARMVLKGLPPLGIGAIAFDLPAHGESEVSGEFLRIENCLTDLSVTDARARVLAPGAEIVYFCSSFGAYITLIYLASREAGGPARAFLRSAAVSMPRIFITLLKSEQRELMKASGEIILKGSEYGYSRDLKLTQGFLDDLARFDVFSLWRPGTAGLCMVHGEADEVVPLVDVESFAGMFDVPLTVIPGGDHKLSVPGAPELVLKTASEFYL